MFERFSHRRRLLDLEERFEKLQRDFNALQLEWTNTLDKLQSIAGRMAKRAALAQEKEDALMGQLPDATNGDTTPPLSPRQRFINEQVLARRRALGQKGGG